MHETVFAAVKCGCNLAAVIEDGRVAVISSADAGLAAVDHAETAIYGGLTAAQLAPMAHGLVDAEGIIHEV